jgi:hypothetical protein
MRLIIVALAVLLSWLAVRPFQQTSVASLVHSQNLGTFANGKYLNETLGLKPDLPTGWMDDPESPDADNPRHLLIRFGSQLDRMNLSGTR